MKYITAFNNNVALVKDSSGLEWIVMGTGVGFRKSKGDLIDDSIVRRKFVAEQSPDRRPFLQVLSDIDSDVLDASVESIKNAESQLNVTFNNNIYLTLADHLNFAVKRAHDNIDYPDMNRCEVKNLYPKEYEAAQETIRLIFDRLDVLLPKSEETFLCYHFVNAQQKQRTQIEETLKMTEVINRIIKIVEYHFQISLDKDSFNYTRFITHLRYFFIRQFKQTMTDDEDMDQTVLEAAKNKYEKAYQATEKIAALFKQKYNWTVSSNEKLYLTLHIWRVTNQQRSE